MVSVACVGVRISMMFHLMFVNNILLVRFGLLDTFLEIAALSVCVLIVLFLYVI